MENKGVSLESDQILKDTILSIVSEQLDADDPKETRQAYERLLNDGISEGDAKLYLAQAVTIEIWDTIRNEKPFNNERYVKNLKNLPAEPVV